MKEWVAGRLALEMGINVAFPTLVQIPRALVAGNEEYERELGDGMGFGSLRVDGSDRLALEAVQNDPDGKLSRILLFDWWVRNSDRALTHIGGNPNLVLRVQDEAVVAIDFDNAFDENFEENDFWDHHALRAHRAAFHVANRTESLAWLAGGQEAFHAIWREIPEEWLHDDYGDPRTSIEEQMIEEILNTPFASPEEFWKLSFAQ